MKLVIHKSIQLSKEHTPLPEWLFHRGDKIIPQTICLEENPMRELLVFISQYGKDFNMDKLSVTAIALSEIILDYDLKKV